MKREADNAWQYIKYSNDVKQLRNLVKVVIEEDKPRYLKHLPDSIHEIVKRIVEYKISRAEINKIDSYFDVGNGEKQ